MTPKPVEINRVTWTDKVRVAPHAHTNDCVSLAAEILTNFIFVGGSKNVEKYIDIALVHASGPFEHDDFRCGKRKG